MPFAFRGHRAPVAAKPGSREGRGAGEATRGSSGRGRPRDLNKGVSGAPQSP